MKLNQWYIHTVNYSPETINERNKEYGTSIDSVQLAIGLAEGHPYIRDGEPLRTSMLVAIEADRVTTLNSVYELGEPADEDSVLYLKACLGLY